MSFLVLVVDDEPDVEMLFRQQFRRDLRDNRFKMDFAQSARNREAGDRSLNQKSPLFAGISPTMGDGFSDGRTAWLATQC